jgi:hypothetical protein
MVQSRRVAVDDVKSALLARMFRIDHQVLQQRGLTSRICIIAILPRPAPPSEADISPPTPTGEPGSEIPAGYSSGLSTLLQVFVNAKARDCVNVEVI